MKINKALVAGMAAGILIIGALAVWLAKGGSDAVESLWSSLTSSYVAKVNGETITRKELTLWTQGIKKQYESQGFNFNDEQGKAHLAELERYVLDGLIETKLMMQEAKARNLLPSEADVEADLKQYKEQIFQGDENKYRDFLKEQGIDESFLRESIRYKLAQAKLFEAVVSEPAITEQMMLDYYQKNKGDFIFPAQIQTAHILLKTEEEAKQVIQQLQNHADFEQLAVEKSIDPTAKANKGTLGYKVQEELTETVGKEFSDAAFSLKKGEYTKTPVKSAQGYHVIRVTDIKPEMVQSYEEAKETIKGNLEIQFKEEQYTKYFEEVRAKAQIENRLAPAAPPAQGQPVPGQ